MGICCISNTEKKTGVYDASNPSSRSLLRSEGVNDWLYNSKSIIIQEVISKCEICEKDGPCSCLNCMKACDFVKKNYDGNGFETSWHYGICSEEVRNILSIFNRGMIDYSDKNFEEALTYFAEIIELNEHGKNHYPSYFYSGECYRTLGNFKESIEYYTQAIEMNPEQRLDGHLAFLGRGKSFFAMKDHFEEAVEDFSKFIHLKPNDSRGYSWRAHSYYQLEKYNLSLKNYLLAILFDDSNDNVFNNIGNLYFNYLKNYAKALYFYSESLRVNPIDDITYICRARCYTELEEFEFASQDFESAIRLNHMNYEIYLFRGEMYTRMEKYIYALKDYGEALELNPYDHRVYKFKGEYHFKRKKYEEAIEMLNISLRISENDDSSYVSRGIVYSEIEEYDLSLEDYKSAISINNQNHLAFFNIGVLYLRMKEYRLASQSLLKAIQLDPSDSNSLGFLMEFFSIINKVEESRKEYDRFISLNPSHPFSSSLNNNENNIYIYNILQDLSKKIRQKRFETDQSILLHKEEVEKLCNQLKNYESKIWFPFIRNVKKEEEEGIEEQKEEMIIDIENRSFSVFRTLEEKGEKFQKKYLCRIPLCSSLFILYLSNNKSLNDKKKPHIEDHPNICKIILKKSTDSRSSLDWKRLPEYEELWNNEEEVISSKKINMMFTKYNHKDLDRYLKQRIKEKKGFHSLEICYVLQSILEGVSHLHKNMIVHRDLREKIIFVDPIFGGIWISDFGYCLDLRNRDGSFLVHRDDEILLKTTSMKEDEVVMITGGKIPMFSAPEIRYANLQQQTHLDYSKSDLFSIGMIGFHLISRFLNNNDDETYRRKKTISKEKMGKKPLQSGLEENHDHVFVIQELLKVDPSERIGFGDSVGLIKDIIRNLEDETNIEILNHKESLIEFIEGDGIEKEEVEGEND